MKVSQKQILAMFQILQDSIKKNVIGLFTIPIEQRIQLVQTILNQQNDELIDFDEK